MSAMEMVGDYSRRSYLLFYDSSSQLKVNVMVIAIIGYETYSSKKNKL